MKMPEEAKIKKMIDDITENYLFDIAHGLDPSGSAERLDMQIPDLVTLVREFVRSEIYKSFIDRDEYYFPEDYQIEWMLKGAIVFYDHVIKPRSNKRFEGLFD